MSPEFKEVKKHFPLNSRKRSNVTAVALLGFCVTLWGLTTWLIFVSPIYFSWIAILLNGLTVAMLFIVGHDAAHDNFFTSHRFNRVIGTLAFLPSLHPFSSWTRSHNLKHHAWTNLKGQDPAYAPYSFADYRALPLARRIGERMYRSFLGLGLLYFMELYCKDMMFPARNHRPANHQAFLNDRRIVWLFLAIHFAAAIAVSAWTERQYPVLFAAYAALGPFIVFNWLMGFVTFQHHTNPEIPWFDQEEEWAFFQCQVAGTTHIQFPRFLDFLFLNIFEHSAHHVDPQIPLYHLQSSQRALEVAYPGTIKIIIWSPAVLWRTLTRCKLYDYTEHQWLDFNGHPTTPRLMTMPRCAELASVPASANSVSAG